MTPLLNLSAALCIVLGVGVAFYGVISLPRWLFASVVRGSIWTMRDALFDARTSGQLPDHPAVNELMQRAEDVIVRVRDITVFRVWLVYRHFDDSDLEPVEWQAVDHLQAEQMTLIRQYRAELSRLVLLLYMVSSWLGIMAIVPKNLAVLRLALHSTLAEREPGAREATPPASTPSPIQRNPGAVAMQRRVGPALRHMAPSDGDLVGAGP